MRLLLVALILALPAAASADVYRYINEAGQVVYTDTPPPEAERVEIDPLTVVDTEPVGFVPAQVLGNEEEEESAETLKLSMVSPHPKETFHGTGNSLVVRLSTATSAPAGAQMLVLLDGQRQGVFSSLAVRLDGIPRGTHTVTAKLLGENGQVLGSIGPRTFYMKQHSILND